MLAAEVIRFPGESVGSKSEYSLSRNLILAIVIISPRYMDAPFRRKAFLNLERFSVIKIPSPPLLDLHSKYFYPIFQLSSLYISSKNLSGNFQQRISKPSIYYTLCSIFKDQKLRSYNRVPHVVEDVERRGRAKPSARQLEIRLVRFLHQRLACHIPEKEQNRALEGEEISIPGSRRVQAVSKLWPADNKKVEASCFI